MWFIVGTRDNMVCNIKEYIVHFWTKKDTHIRRLSTIIVHAEKYLKLGLEHFHSSKKE